MARGQEAAPAVPQLTAGTGDYPSSPRPRRVPPEVRANGQCGRGGSLDSTAGPGVPSPDPGPAVVPPIAGPRVVPEDCWLPGLGLPTALHLVAADTIELPGDAGWVRAVCDHTCLLTSVEGTPYELLAVHDVCARAVRMLCRP